MKKFILIATTALFSFIAANAQNPSKFIYAELVGQSSGFSKSLSISIDYGQKANIIEDLRVRDDNCKVIKCNSMVDALNWMGEMGWEFGQAFTVSAGTAGVVYHWLLKLDVSQMSSEEQAAVFDKFNTKNN